MPQPTAREFVMKPQAPIPDPLAALGKARTHWDAFLARARADVPEAEVAWKTYAGASGTQCVIRMSGRNLAYLKPGEGWFLASFALSDAAIVRLSEARLPAELIQEVEASPKYPEGRPARVRVDSAAACRTAAKLLAIKAADVRAGPRRGKG